MYKPLNVHLISSGAIAVKWSNYFNSENPIMKLNRVDCGGSESSLTECRTDRNGLTPTTCQRGPAAIVCQGVVLTNYYVNVSNLSF